MKVTQVIADDNGNRNVQIEINELQTRFILEVGIGVLLAAGAANFTPVEGTENEGTLEIDIAEESMH